MYLILIHLFLTRKKNNFQLYQMCSEHYNPVTWNKNWFRRKQILSFTKWEQIHY